MDVAISYDPGTKEYRFYEPTTNTLLVSNNLGEGFANLNFFLVQSGKVSGNIVTASDISYHIDSATFRGMVESNINLMKRLQTGQSEFKTSSDRFGMSAGGGQSGFAKSSLQGGPKGGFGKSKFGGSKSSFGKSDKKWNN